MLRPSGRGGGFVIISHIQNLLVFLQTTQLSARLPSCSFYYFYVPCLYQFLNIPILFLCCLILILAFIHSPFLFLLLFLTLLPLAFFLSRLFIELLSIKPHGHCGVGDSTELPRSHFSGGEHNQLHHSKTAVISVMSIIHTGITIPVSMVHIFSWKNCVPAVANAYGGS